MKYESRVLCPHPDCEWQARVEIGEPPVASKPIAGTWRDGAFRDALDYARRRHVVDEHVRVSIGEF